MSAEQFYDDEFDALNRMIAGSTRSFKEVAAYLYPHLKPESAYARLKACVNPEKDERLTFGQILAAMKFCGRYDPLMYACDETLHARPDRKAAADEEVRLVAAIADASATLVKAMAALDRINAARG